MLNGVDADCKRRLCIRKIAISACDRVSHGESLLCCCPGKEWLDRLAGSHETSDEEAVVDQRRMQNFRSHYRVRKSPLQGKDQSEASLRSVRHSGGRGLFPQIRQNLRRDLERADPCAVVVDHPGHHQLVRLEGVDQGAQPSSHRCGRAGGGT